MEYCRTCVFKVESGNSIDIFNSYYENTLISEILKRIAPVEMFENDFLSNAICGTCFEKLKCTLAFRRQIVSSDYQARSRHFEDIERDNEMELSTVCSETEAEARSFDDDLIVNESDDERWSEAVEVSFNDHRELDFVEECCTSEEDYDNFTDHTQSDIPLILINTMEAHDITIKEEPSDENEFDEGRIFDGETICYSLQCACEYCNHINGSLFTHFRRLHQVERPHACEICGKRFTRAARLNIHVVKSHKDVKQDHIL